MPHPPKSAVSSRRSRACSLEPPHPAGPRNAVKRSTRKYHSAVTRNWLIRLLRYRALFLPFTYQSNKALKNRQFINVRTKSRGYGLYGIYGQRATHTKMGKADFMGFLNRNELRFISKVSQKLVKPPNRGKMSTNRGGESGLDFD